MFRSWSAELAPEIEVCAIRLPGRENRVSDPTFTRLAPLVQSIGRALLPYVGLPFAFFGHSMGALIAFELARLLRRTRGAGPLRLFVSASRAPHLPSRVPAIHALHQDAFLAEVRRLNGTPEELLESDELMRLILPTIRADIEICETYAHVPEPPLECPISVFGGSEDRRVSPEELLAWHRQTRSGFSFRLFPGDHFFLHGSQGPLLRAIAQDVTD